MSLCLNHDQHHRISYSIPCLMQLELTLLRIESRLKDIPDHGEEFAADNMSFMVDVDEIE